MAAYSALLGLIWRRSGYGYGGGVSNLVRGRCGSPVLGGGGGCVSRSFSSVSTTGRQMSPWLMLTPQKEDGDWFYKFFSVAEKRVLSFNWSKGNCLDFDPFHRSAELVGTSRGWLCVVNYTTGNMFLINPITRRHIKLPSLNPFIDTASQILLSCSPDEEEEGECRALIVCNEDERLAFCCPNRSDAKWTPLGDSYYDSFFESFAYLKRQKLFFSATDQDTKGLVAWDLGDPLSPKRIPIDFSPERDRSPYRFKAKLLVVNEDTDDLFLLRRLVHYNDINKPITTFDVHRYDPKSGTFRYMERGGSSLDGLSFFIVGKRYRFALSPDKFPELKPNAIYFDSGVFSYEDGTVSPLCGLPAYSWFTPNSTSN